MEAHLFRILGRQLGRPDHALGLVRVVDHLAHQGDVMMRRALRTWPIQNPGCVRAHRCGLLVDRAKHALVDDLEAHTILLLEALEGAEFPHESRGGILDGEVEASLDQCIGDRGGPLGKLVGHLRGRMPESLGALAGPQDLGRAVLVGPPRR